VGTQRLVGRVDVMDVDSRYSACDMLASVEDRHDIAAVLLRHGAKVNQQDKHGQTALTFAVYNGFHRVAQVLLHYNADISVKNQVQYVIPRCVTYISVSAAVGNYSCSKYSTTDITTTTTATITTFGRCSVGLFFRRLSKLGQLCASVFQRRTFENAECKISFWTDPITQPTVSKH